MVSLMLILLAVLLPEAYAQKEYKFGTLYPMTGRAAWIGEAYLEGSDMAVNEINSKGGVEGVMLRAIKEDHKANPKDAANAATKLATLDKVPYIISSFTAITLAAQPIAAANKVLIVNIGGTGSDLLKKTYLYNSQIIGAYGLPPLVDYFWEQGLRKLATIVCNDAFGLNTRKDFVDRWEKLGGKVVANELFAEGATDFSAQLAKIKAVSPDCIATSLVGATGSALVIQMRELGLKQPVADTPGDIPGMQKIGKPAEGIVFAGSAVNPDTKSPFARHYVDLYRKTYKKEPLDWMPANAYEAVYVLVELIKRVKKEGGDIYSGENLLKALEKDTKFPSVYDTIMVFLPDHGCLKQITIKKAVFREGKIGFETVKVVPVEKIPH
jgi:branched-chain amino acid transport system substrate-binding protein